LTTDTCVYVRLSKSGKLIIISLFVDDIVAAYDKQDEKEWLVIRNLFMSQYKMKDLGDVNHILGMKVIRDRAKGTLTLDQSQYLHKVLEKFNMVDCKAAPTPESNVKLSQSQCPTDEQGKLDVPYESVVG